MKTRKEWLDNLLSMSESLSDISRGLSNFTWDSSNDLIYLHSSHIIHLLTRYLDSTLSKNEVEKWANLIEGREDIGFNFSDEEKLKTILFELANPELTADLTPHRAQEIIALLN